jgi:hypothetical protein
MTVATHPAASLETLSRRHDGELSPAELEAFEAHLAQCEECREATAAFERSLAAFRTAPDAPVPSDLPARILRKIRAQSPSRRPFGVMFGIDIRWAGVFLAALLVAIIAPTFLSSRREANQTAAAPSSEPLTAHVVDAEAASDSSKETRDAQSRPPQGKAKDAAAANGAAAPPESNGAAAAPGSNVVAAAPESKTRALAPEPKAADQLAGGRLDQPAAAPEAPTPAAAPPAEKAQAAPDGRHGSAKAAPRRSAAFATPERAGGEAGGFFQREEAQAAEVRVDVRALDSEGPAPDLARTPPAPGLSSLRGREFVLVVGADGVVRSVEPAGHENERQKLLKDSPALPADSTLQADKKAESVEADEGAASVLLQLRFQATGKARRVLVDIR